MLNSRGYKKNIQTLTSDRMGSSGMGHSGQLASSDEEVDQDDLKKPLADNEKYVIPEEKVYINEIQPFKFSWRKLMGFMGPGFLMSIAYLDPGNIAGDLQAGTDGKYSLIWTLMWATILGWYYQVLSAKIGVVTQRNLAKVCA